MNRVMDINSLLERLIKLTNENKCQWDELSITNYRLVLNEGTIQIKQTIEDFNTTLYTIKLFDKSECFATFHSDDEDYRLNSLSEDLFNSIKKYRKRSISMKISDVFGDL